MTFKICGRRGGKTTAILRLAADNPRACVIAASKQIAEVTVSMYPILKGRVFSVEEAKAGCIRGFDTVHIDNLDLMLIELFHLSGLASIGTVTATGNLDLSRNPIHEIVA